jgi:hypothetical protein
MPPERDEESEMKIDRAKEQKREEKSRHEERGRFSNDEKPKDPKDRKAPRD